MNQPRHLNQAGAHEQSTGEEGHDPDN